MAHGTVLSCQGGAGDFAPAVVDGQGVPAAGDLDDLGDAGVAFLRLRPETRQSLTLRRHAPTVAVPGRGLGDQPPLAEWAERTLQTPVGARKQRRRSPSSLLLCSSYVLEAGPGRGISRRP